MPPPPPPLGRVDDRCGVAGSNDDEPVREDETEEETPGGNDMLMCEGEPSSAMTG